MYGIAGERRLTEWEVPWLPGYEGSAPVRVGNAAHGQLQLDVFGEVMDTLHQARCQRTAASKSGWALQQAFLSHLERIWIEPDEGIWEMRGERRHFTYSKVMAWVAFDRAIKSAEQFGLDGPLDRWREIAAAIHADVCRRGFDRELGSFVQSYESKASRCQPAAATAGRLSASGRSARARDLAGDRAPAAGRRIRDAIRHRGFRRRAAAGGRRIPGVQLLAGRRLYPAAALAGRATRCSTACSSCRNDVGLLSEEYDPRLSRLVGNFPQAFTHVALVNSAFNLTRFEKPVEQRARPAAEDLSVPAEAGLQRDAEYRAGASRSCSLPDRAMPASFVNAARNRSPHDLRSFSEITRNSAS